MFTLVRFHFYPFLLMSTLPVYIALFSNECAMKMIGIDAAPAKWCCQSPLHNKAFVSSCQKGTSHEFECYGNLHPINKVMLSVFKCFHFGHSH